MKSGEGETAAFIKRAINRLLQEFSHSKTPGEKVSLLLSVSLLGLNIGSTKNVNENQTQH